MPTPQALLTERLAEQFKLEIVRFRHTDSLLLSSDEILKLFVPSSKRMLFGTPTDRMIVGYLWFVRSQDLKRLRAPSKKFEQPEFFASAYIANFPWITKYSVLSEDQIDPRFIECLQALCRSLPNQELDWDRLFGDAFFEMPPLEKAAPLVSYLREKLPSNCAG